MEQTSVTIQITPESKPAIPCWMGEVAAFAQILAHTGIRKQIQPQARFARTRFGKYDLIDFVVVLMAYILSGEPTLLAYYERFDSVGGRLYGALRARPLAPSLNVVSISGGPRPEHGGSPAHTFLSGCAYAHSLSFPWWPVRPDRCAVAGHRCGWNLAGGAACET